MGNETKPMDRTEHRNEKSGEAAAPHGLMPAPLVLTPKRSLVPRLVGVLMLGVQGSPDGPDKTQPPTLTAGAGENTCVFRVEDAALKKSKGSIVFEFTTEARSVGSETTTRCVNRRTVVAFSDGEAWTILPRTVTGITEEVFSSGMAAVSTDCYVSDGCLVFTLYSDTVAVKYTATLSARKLPATADGTRE